MADVSQPGAQPSGDSFGGLFSSVEQHMHDGKGSQILPVAYIIIGSGAPSSTPPRIGFLYFDYTNAKVYGSTGMSSSTDWKALN